ncbi:MAG: DUF881 domain-containing protein [Bacillota bacterium]|nr:DUF881 domain-containing protein [Bacillota bacterium]
MKKKDAIWIGLACLILGVVISFQYKFYQDTHLRDPGKTENLMTELATLKEEKRALQEENRSLEAQLDEIKNSASQDSVLVKNLTDDLNRYKAFAGMTKVSGEGIIVTLSDPPSEPAVGASKLLAYNYRMVLELVNELYASGAEAISINDQRLVNNSEIRVAGNQLNVNLIPLSTPYVIRVIGSADTLEAAINQRFGILENIRKQGFLVETSKKPLIEIQPFSGVIRFRYASVVK